VRMDWPLLVLLMLLAHVALLPPEIEASAQQHVGGTGACWESGARGCCCRVWIQQTIRRCQQTANKQRRVCNAFLVTKTVLVSPPSLYI
jgi:hypothetical protein